MRYWKQILALAMLTALFLTSGCAEQNKREEAFLWGQADATEVDVNTKVPGRLIELYVKEGSLVHKGDILAKIDAREQDTLNAAAKAKVAEATAANLQAKANLTQAERDIARYSELYKRVLFTKKFMKTIVNKKMYMKQCTNNPRLLLVQQLQLLNGLISISVKQILLLHSTV